MLYASIFGMCMLMFEGSAETPVAVATATATAGVAPSLDVIGPSGGTEGDVILLAAKSDTATHISWNLVSGPVDKNGNQAVILPLENNQKCFVQSKAGLYLVVCVASNADGNVSKVWSINITANNGPNPPPPPDPTIDLNSTYGAVKLTYDQVRGKDKALLTTMANNYTALAKKYEGTSLDIDTIAEDERVTNRSNTTDAQRAVIGSWATAKIAAFEELFKQGRVVTGAQYASLMAEYAKGFSLAAGGK